MNFLKKNWPFIAIGLVSLLLGVLAILTADKLRNEKAVAPTAPQSKPQALEGNPVVACTLTFNLNIATPTPTPTPTPTSTPTVTPTPTPTPSPTPTPTVTPSPTPTSTPTSTPTVTPTPTPSNIGGPVCGTTCTGNPQCPENMICYIVAGETTGACRNPSCQTDTDCVCPPAPSTSPTPNPTPSVTPEVPVAGSPLPTLFLIGTGVMLLLVGLVLI